MQRNQEVWMKKKKKKTAVVIHETRDLDWYMKYFKPVCECGSQFSVHAHRKKTRMKDETIFASCINKECENYHLEAMFTPDGTMTAIERRKTNALPGVSADNFDWSSLHNNTGLGNIN